MQLHRYPANINVWHAGPLTPPPPFLYSPLNNNNRISTWSGLGDIYIYIYAYKIGNKDKRGSHIICNNNKKYQFLRFRSDSVLCCVVLCNSYSVLPFWSFAGMCITGERDGWQTEVPWSNGSSTMVEMEHKVIVDININMHFVLCTE